MNDEARVSALVREINTSDRSQYQREYYELNKAKISDQRRRKYQDDPEYRKRIRLEAEIRRSRDRSKRRKQKQKAIDQGVPTTKHHRGPRPPVMIQVGGKSLEAFTVTQLSIHVLRSVEALNLWTSRGQFPMTPFRGNRNERLYTMGMMNVVKSVVDKYGFRSSGKPGFRADIVDGWRKIGIAVE